MFLPAFIHRAQNLSQFFQAVQIFTDRLTFEKIQNHVNLKGHSNSFSDLLQ